MLECMSSAYAPCTLSYTQQYTYNNGNKHVLNIYMYQTKAPSVILCSGTCCCLLLLIRKEGAIFFCFDVGDQVNAVPTSY